MVTFRLRCTALAFALVLCIGCQDDGEPAASATAPSVEDSANDQGGPDVGMVVFQSKATNLVSGDTNNRDDIFVRDPQTGATTRVSVATGGTQGDGHSLSPVVSSTGRYVAFWSTATNLVTGGTIAPQVFVRDRKTGATHCASVDGAGNPGNGTSRFCSISADGRYVAFASCATNLVAEPTTWEWDVFVHDRQTGTTTLASVNDGGQGGNAWSYIPAISGDGRYVAFVSFATNLVAQNTNGLANVFVRDLQTGKTSRVSVGLSGGPANFHSDSTLAISLDGRYVAFDSVATNLAAGDTNGTSDVFVHDRQTGITTRVSVDGAGNQGNGGSYAAAMSADGRYVAFHSSASNLFPGDTNDWADVFVHDRQTGSTSRVSVDSTGTQANFPSEWPVMSPNGRYVTFMSFAGNLVGGDTNERADVFVHDRHTGATTRVSVGGAGSQGDGHSGTWRL